MIIDASPFTHNSFLQFLLMPSLIVRLLIIFVVGTIKAMGTVAFMKHRRRVKLKISLLWALASIPYRILSILLKQSKNVVGALLVLTSPSKHPGVVFLNITNYWIDL
jgi:hypothetical protein